MRIILESRHVETGGTLVTRAEVTEDTDFRIERSSSLRDRVVTITVPVIVVTIKGSYVRVVDQVAMFTWKRTSRD